MSDLYPIKLCGVTVDMLWGGSRLRDLYGKPGATDKTGESWELTLRNDRICKIQNGKYARLTLREYIAAAGCRTVSDDFDGGAFPLLIKFIDAAETLSLQVHPDDQYAAQVESGSGKTEMWYIIDALPDAEIIYGLADNVTAEDYRAAAVRGDFLSSLRRVKVRAGDVFFIPAGMLHAIGGGIFIAEIQQNSDTTYRVYDYDRRDSDGNTRELHTQNAFDVIRDFAPEQIEYERFCAAKSSSAAADPTLLVHCKYFKVHKYDIYGKNRYHAGADSFHALLFVAGSGKILHSGNEYTALAGDCWLIPAGSGEYALGGEMSVIVTALK